MPSGVALFLCALLPTLRVCSSSRPDNALPGFVLPPLWPMYLLGLAVAIAAVRWARSQAWGRVVLGLIWGTCFAGLLMLVIEAASGDAPVREALAVIAAAVALASPTIGPFGERLVARSSTIAAGTCAILFAVIARDRDFVWGVWVACVTSALLAAGCLWWWFEARGGEQ